MKQMFLLPLLVLILTLLAKQKQPEIAIDVYAKQRTAIACFPERSRALVIDGIGLLPGSGKHHWQVSRNDSAQIYFDQGMNMYYSFHIIEALASFVKAQQFDPENAMLHWGEALTYSPNINDVGYIQPEDAMKAVQKANALASQRSTIEKDFITAMHKRFSADPTISRERLNIDYKDAMAALAAKYPTNVEVLALYADALMILHPWDLYHGVGKPKAWTPQLVEVLEKGLGIDTEHPGLNHYYIHAVEGSSNPGRGITSADKLDRIVPGASHMVHMPSHIYIRTGNYARGIAVNEAALRGYSNYLAIYPKVAAGNFLYQVHNTHLMAACAIMNGNMAKAIQVSKDCMAQVPEEYHHMDGPMAEFMQYASATPIFAYIRYGQWDQLLAPAAIADSSLYLRILHAFGRGFAHARQGRISAAEAELTSLTYIMENNPKLKEKAFNSAYDGANVAKHMLAGVIAELKKDYEHAAVLLRQAAELEEGMVYNEPKDWILPPLPYLGNVLLKDNKFMEAEKVFRKDLAFNPSNLWGLRGLMLAQLYQGKKSEANKTSKVLAAAMVYSDFGKLEGAVF
jgi:hypothetical protein